MKKYKIRKGSIADVVIRNRNGLAMIAAASIILAGMSAATLAFAEEPSTMNQPKSAEVSAEKVDTSTMNQPISAAEVCEEVNTEPELWAVPLEEDLQLHIADLCEEYHIQPELVLAVIGKESQYNPEAIGDSGNSLGLMQIQPRWHSKRMQQLGCDDLLDPYQNVVVGVDILAEKLAKGSTEWALMAYNGGNQYADALQARGEVSEYAEAVIMLAEELKGGAEDAIQN